MTTRDKRTYQTSRDRGLTIRDGQLNSWDEVLTSRDSNSDKYLFIELLLSMLVNSSVPAGQFPIPSVQSPIPFHHGKTRLRPLP